MCEDCLRRYGVTADVITNVVREVAAMIDEWYELPHNGAGGWLHIVTDDSNVGDASIRYCLDTRHTLDCDPETESLGVAIAERLLAMSLAERAAAVNFHLVAGES